MSKHIFCFGSNLAGVHGAGAALYARKHHGAIYGQGIGLQSGNNSSTEPRKQNVFINPHSWSSGQW